MGLSIGRGTSVKMERPKPNPFVKLASASYILNSYKVAKWDVLGLVEILNHKLNDSSIPIWA